MIVSASYVDDIPAFYGPWFMKRLEAGFCRTFDTLGLQRHRVPLTREAVDGFVFWTRNALSFLPEFGAIRERGFPFVVQYGFTGDSVHAVDAMHALAARFGPRSVVWRYEPVAVSTQKTLGVHIEEFEGLAADLEGSTDEAVVGFAEAPKDDARAEEDMRTAIKRLALIAAARGMRLTLCSRPDCLVPAASPARCIDARRLSDVAARALVVETRARWPGCLCANAFDIGGPAGRSALRGAALTPMRVEHDENGEFLVPPPDQPAVATGAELSF